MKIRRPFLNRGGKILQADGVNEFGQVTDKKILNRDRLKFGVGSVMYQSEESAFTPLHTVIIRALGGNDIHLGLIGAATSSAGSLCQWMGAVLLKKYESNRRAMLIALLAGVIFAVLLFVTVMGGVVSQEWGIICAGLYIVFLFGLSAATGVQNNIETNWIGDLVPLEMRGWFTSMKWIISAVGVLVLLVAFGQLAVRWPSLPVLSLAFIYMAVTTLIAMWLISTVTERKPQTVSFFRAKAEKSLMDYRNPSLWKFVWFLSAWASGRIALVAFSTAYMIDHLDMRMDRIVLVAGVSSLVSIAFLFFVGRISDKIGTKKPLLVISMCVSISMLLWVASSWWGLWPLILYQLINGAAGNTHSMLTINYGLEILPAKGRSAYFSVARLLVGVVAITVSALAGYFMSLIRGTSIELFGLEINHYQIFFFGCSLLTISSVIPLLIGKEKAIDPLKVNEVTG